MAKPIVPMHFMTSTNRIESNLLWGSKSRLCHSTYTLQLVLFLFIPSKLDNTSTFVMTNFGNIEPIPDVLTVEIHCNCLEFYVSGKILNRLGITINSQFVQTGLAIVSFSRRTKIMWMVADAKITMGKWQTSKERKKRRISGLTVKDATRPQPFQDTNTPYI